MKDGVLFIYFSIKVTKKPATRSAITKALLKLLNYPLKESDSILYFDGFLEYNGGEIPSFLDEMNILKEDSGESVREGGKNPTLGDAIPTELHGNLRNDLERNLERDEYVGYDESGTGKFFVYAKIINIDNKNNTYDIKVSDEDDVDLVWGVPRSKLHKFDRSYEKNSQTDHALPKEQVADNAVALNEEVSDDYAEENKERSYEEIAKEIQGIVNDLKNKDEAEQKRVMRRLYLTWHPDKNPNKELATKVFQFLQNELKKLNKDFSENHEQWKSDASDHYRSRKEYAENFRQHFSQRSSQDRSHQHHRPDNDFFHRFTQKNPQPAEARRWYRQAEFDLRMAKKIIKMSDPKSYEWICYMASQVKSFLWNFDELPSIYNFQLAKPNFSYFW